MPRMSCQCNVVRGQQLREILAAEKGVFLFALEGERIEADQGLIDEAGMAHDETAFRQPIEELSHQRAEIRLPGKVIGAGECRIEGDTGAGGAVAELRAAG